jgi:hypothetical protein
VPPLFAAHVRGLAHIVDIGIFPLTEALSREERVRESNWDNTHLMAMFGGGAKPMHSSERG